MSFGECFCLVYGVERFRYTIRQKSVMTLQRIEQAIAQHELGLQRLEAEIKEKRQLIVPATKPREIFEKLPLNLRSVYDVVKVGENGFWES